MLPIKESGTVDNWFTESVKQVDVDDLIEPEGSMTKRRFLQFSTLVDNRARESKTRDDVLNFLILGSSKFDPGKLAPLCTTSILVPDLDTFCIGPFRGVASLPVESIENRKNNKGENNQ